MTPTRLHRLEAASIRILRDVIADADRPVMLAATGPEGAVLLHLAHKAFFPGSPFPLLQINATGKVGEGVAIGGSREDQEQEKNRRPAIWNLVNSTRRRGETIWVFPLAHWTELDVRRYGALEKIPGAGSIGSEESRPVGRRPLRLNVCGGLGAGKSMLAHRVAQERADFIVGDAPEDQRDARGALAAASTADATVVVVDAQAGLSPPTRRQLVLLSLLGARQVVVAVGKMDLVGYGRAVFAAIEKDLGAFVAELKLPSLSCVPISGTAGDNIRERSVAMAWYQGPTLIGLLDAVESDDERRAAQPLRLTVEWVDPVGPSTGSRTGSSTGSDFRGLVGTIVGGRLTRGDAVRVQPSGRITRVSRIATSDGDLEEALAGQSIAISLEDQLPIARGDLIVAADGPAEISDQFEADVIWMNASPLLPGRGYSLKVGAQTVTATITQLKYKTNVNTLERMAGATLGLNEIGVCNLQFDRPVAFDPYRVNHHTGGFIVIDRQSSETVGAGMLHFALRRAQNVHWQAVDVNKAARSAIKGQQACVLWYTGLSGAGKSTIANLVDQKLHEMKRHTYLLDGDNVRHGLNKDLGFTDADRVENIRRIAEVARLMVDAGLIVSTAFISPFRAERMMARALVAEGEFIEIFVDTPLGVAEQRDPKGLYKKARRGDLKNFTGIDSPYEGPESPELRIDTTVGSAEEAAETIVAYLRRRGVLA
jgi:bifunctional enzyme CysN/CysC